MKRIIWQYWETNGFKPLFVDGLHEIAKKNSGVEVILVTPDTIKQFIPDIPSDILRIEEMAHKADMIRSLLLYYHGGMWLDSDAVVLADLNWLFDMLTDYEFIGFNDTGSLAESPLNVRINCFLVRPKSVVIKSWVESQHAKFPKTRYAWTEVGTDLLDPIVRNNQEIVKLLPFDLVCPIKWNEVSRFSSIWENSRKVLDRVQIVMLSNNSLKERNPGLGRTPLDQLSEEDTLIGDIIRKALDANYVPPSYFQKIFRNLTGLFS